MKRYKHLKLSDAVGVVGEAWQDEKGNWYAVSYELGTFYGPLECLTEAWDVVVPTRRAGRLAVCGQR